MVSTLGRVFLLQAHNDTYAAACIPGLHVISHSCTLREIIRLSSAGWVGPPAGRSAERGTRLVVRQRPGGWVLFWLSFSFLSGYRNCHLLQQWRWREANGFTVSAVSRGFPPFRRRPHLSRLYIFFGIEVSEMINGQGRRLAAQVEETAAWETMTRRCDKTGV